jgi:hypothetical protein
MGVRRPTGAHAVTPPARRVLRQHIVNTIAFTMPRGPRATTKPKHAPRRGHRPLGARASRPLTSERRPCDAWSMPGGTRRSRSSRTPRCATTGPRGGRACRSRRVDPPAGFPARGPRGSIMAGGPRISDAFHGQQDRYRLSGKPDAIPVHIHRHHAATCRCLVREQLAFAQATLPVRAKGAMGRPGHWIFVDAGPGREVPRHEVKVPGSARLVTMTTRTCRRCSALKSGASARTSAPDPTSSRYRAFERLVVGAI